MNINIKKIVIIACLLVFSTFAVSTEVIASGEVSNNSIVKENVLQTKVPMGKRQIAYKFLLAMVGVVTSSVVIFVLLSLYNKFFYPKTLSGDSYNVDNDYKTPTNMKDALTIFLKKTK